MTVSWLCHDFLMTVSWPYHDCLMTVLWRKRNYLGFGGPWVSAVSALVLLKKPHGRRRQQRWRGGVIFFLLFSFFIRTFFNASGNKNIGATIRIGWEIWCLLYAGFFDLRQQADLCSKTILVTQRSWNFTIISLFQDPSLHGWSVPYIGIFSKEGLKINSKYTWLR